MIANFTQEEPKSPIGKGVTILLTLPPSATSADIDKTRHKTTYISRRDKLTYFDKNRHISTYINKNCSVSISISLVQQTVNNLHYMPSPGGQKKIKITTRSSNHTYINIKNEINKILRRAQNLVLYTGLQGFQGLSILFWLFDKKFSYLKGLIQVFANQVSVFQVC